jgi:hypothetical protein
MALEPAQNLEETEKNGGEIVSGATQEVRPQGPSVEEAQNLEQDRAAALHEAQDLAQSAREHEAAERAQELNQAREYEHER